MPLAFVQTLGGYAYTSPGFDQTIEIAAGNTVPAGHFIVVGAGYDTEQLGGEPTDTQGNTYTSAGGYENVSGFLGPLCHVFAAKITTPLVGDDGDSIELLGASVAFAFEVEGLKFPFAFSDDGSDTSPSPTLAAPADTTLFVGVAAFTDLFPPGTPPPAPTVDITSGDWNGVGNGVGDARYSFHTSGKIATDVAYRIVTDGSSEDFTWSGTGSAPVQGACVIIAFHGLGEYADGPWNLQTRGGQYHWAYSEAGEILYHRSEHSYPAAAAGPFSLADGGDDHQFRMIEATYPAGRVRGTWVRAGDVVTAYSDDDGETWSDPVTLWADAKNPTVAHDPRSETTLYAAFVTDHLEGRRQGPADSSPGTAFTLTDGSSPLAVDDATFHLFPAADTSGRWLLVLVDGGDVKNFWSGDDGSTWEEV